MSLTTNPKTDEMKKQSIKSLNKFIGQWEARAFFGGNPMDKDAPEFEWFQNITFSWIENGYFLKQVSETISNGDIPDEVLDKLPTPLTCIIGFDDTNNRFTQLYADSRGVFRVYQMSFDGREWRLWREAPGFSQRFTGKFDENGKKISGTWEASEDGKTWTKDFDLEYIKIK